MPFPKLSSLLLPPCCFYICRRVSNCKDPTFIGPKKRAAAAEGKAKRKNKMKKQTQLESDIDTQNITSNVRFILQGGTTGFFHPLAAPSFYHFIELKLSLENNKGLLLISSSIFIVLSLLSDE